MELRAPGTDNPFAIGARLRLLAGSNEQMRDIRVGSGYLSGDAPRAHFGLPDGVSADALEIIWPDGALSRVDAPHPGMRLIVTRAAPTSP